MNPRLIALCLSVLLLCSARAQGGDQAPAVPLLIAAQVDARGNPLPTPPVTAAAIKLLARESGLNLALRPYPWKRAQFMAEHGEGLLFGAAATPQRSPVFLFTKPLYSANQWLISTAQAPLHFQRWEDLDGKVISISTGGKYGPEFEQRRDKLFRIEQSASSAESRMKMLSVGHVDAVLLESFRSKPQFRARLQCAFPGQQWVVADKPLGTEPVMIALPRDSRWASLLPVLNAAIERLGQAQRIQKLLDSEAPQHGC